MLLTLSAISLRAMLVKNKAGKSKMDLLDLPQYTRDELGLHGLNLSTELLTGVSRERLERLRERSDKAGCACLLLIESEAQPFGDAAEAAAAGAVERMQRVIQAGHILGCSAVAVKAAGADETGVFQRTAERLRKAVERAERLELNVLLSPREGLTATPERITELIKKVGGFRVGTFPDFQAAAASGDPVAYLRRLTPYASVVSASTVKFVPEKGKESDSPDAPVKHQPYSLETMAEAILSVGYDGTLAIDYRGTGDAKLGVIRSRIALERLIHGDEALEETDLEDEAEAAPGAEEEDADE
jgi:Xylose isomerase-like TIM barrel